MVNKEGNMQITEIDTKAIERIIRVLATGLKRVDDETPDGKKVTGYWIGDKQIRIDLIEK